MKQGERNSLRAYNKSGEEIVGTNCVNVILRFCDNELYGRADYYIFEVYTGSLLGLSDSFR